jgi:hypothetical protein
LRQAKYIFMPSIIILYTIREIYVNNKFVSWTMCSRTRIWSLLLPGQIDANHVCKNRIQIRSIWASWFS